MFNRAVGTTYVRTRLSLLFLSFIFRRPSSLYDNGDLNGVVTVEFGNNHVWTDFL